MKRIRKMFSKFNKKIKTSDKAVARNLHNGVRLIESDDEFLEAFGAFDNSEESIDAEQKNVPLEALKVGNVEKEKAYKKNILYKNDIPVLNDASDVEKLLNQSCDETQVHSETIEEDIKKRPLGNNLTNRHGIPILKNDDDYASVFINDEKSDNFPEILAESLGNKSAEVLLNEKRDNMGPVKRITKKERIARYPSPQGQLDLHGYTAIKADLNVESYLKNAFRNGTYTVMLIVGKGLHSENGPVLPDLVEQRVIRMINDKIVFAYEWDKNKKSKSGAMTVFLNNYHTRGPHGSF